MTLAGSGDEQIYRFLQLAKMPLTIFKKLQIHKPKMKCTIEQNKFSVFDPLGLREETLGIVSLTRKVVA
jgi:hypothetical protein